MRTLSQRILVVTLAGGLIVAIVTFALALPLVRDVARNEARDQLVRSVETFASRPAASARLLAREREALGPDDRRFIVVLPDGHVVGDDRGLLTAERAQTLLTTGRLSASATIDGEEVLVEGRMTRQRFGAVGLQPAGSVDDATASFVRRLLLSVLIGLAAAGVLGFVLSRTLTRSVGETAAVARRLAAGERGVPVGESSVSEIADMGHAIAALDEALSTSEGRQREFLLSVSHEIRTPLTALRGYAEALAEGAIDPEDVRATGEVLVTETQRIDRFVADLLALARLEADDFDLEVTAVDLGALIADLGSAWRATSERAGVRLTASPVDVTVRADPMRLRQLLDGLVENAVRVAPDGGSVEVRVRPDGDDVVVEVEDDGPGLTSDDAEVAFERGSLHTKYAPHRPVGTGLGLSIARRLAERMHAELSAAPGSLGGAVFSLRLPGA